MYRQLLSHSESTGHGESTVKWLLSLGYFTISLTD